MLGDVLSISLAGGIIDVIRIIPPGALAPNTTLLSRCLPQTITPHWASWLPHLPDPPRDGHSPASSTEHSPASSTEHSPAPQSTVQAHRAQSRPREHSPDTQSPVQPAPQSTVQTHRAQSSQLQRAQSSSTEHSPDPESTVQTQLHRAQSRQLQSQTTHQPCYNLPAGWHVLYFIYTGLVTTFTDASY